MIKGLYLALLISTALFSCSKTDKYQNSMDSTRYSEQYRPQYHFSPATNWTNDPNGLVYYEGEYHLFFQYNPYGTTWGHMSWGHAVSKDLLHWEQLPVALAEYQDPATGDSTMIFSGTVVVDRENSSGLCEGNDCLVALYTSHVHKNGEGKLQHQSLAYSNDKGRTWKRYDKNPVLNIQRKDFRDPKVFWHEPTKSWVMVLVVPDLFKVQFYRSNNLTSWTLSGEFGGAGDVSKIWECPDVYELPVENEAGKKKWVLSLSGSHPQGGKFVGMQYFIGDFDGSTFRADDTIPPTLYVDYGKDFYAGIVFNNIPAEDGRTIMIGWANNWAYGNKIPTSPWRSAMSLPRELSLRKTNDGIRLIQRPLRSISKLRGKEIVDLNSIGTRSFELEIELNVADNPESGILLFRITGNETIIGYNALRQEVFIDRNHSGDISFDKSFTGIDSAPVKPVDGKIQLQIFVDNSIVEIFINDGERTMCEQIFPPPGQVNLLPFPSGAAKSISIKAWELNSTWVR